MSEAIFFRAGAGKTKPSATAVEPVFAFAGDAAAGSGSARVVCRRIFGGCPVTGSLGNARIVAVRTDSEINDKG